MAASARGATKPPNTHPGPGSPSSSTGAPGPGSKRASPKGRGAGDVDLTDQKAAVRDYKKELAAYDRKMSAAYEAGRSGKPAGADFDDDQAAAHSSGVEEAAQPAAAAPVAPPAPSGPTWAGKWNNGVNGGITAVKGKASAQGAPFILGMVAYCLAVNWLRGGMAGVKGWFTAKFENKVTYPTSSSSSSNSGGAPTNTSGSSTSGTNNTSPSKTGSATNHGPYSGYGIYGRGGK